MVVSAYLLDTIQVNSSKLNALNRNMDPKKQSSFEFGYSLAEQLILPQIRKRNKMDWRLTWLEKLRLSLVK